VVVVRNVLELHSAIIAPRGLARRLATHARVAILHVVVRVMHRNTSNSPVKGFDFVYD
jgi:hypothetical protein